MAAAAAAEAAADSGAAFHGSAGSHAAAGTRWSITRPPRPPPDALPPHTLPQADWDAVSAAALALFAFGQAEAAQRGLLLVDTKYEFGKDEQGNILLIDEIHTPDSSRYWLAESYAARHAGGQEPENIDKEFLRLWFRAHCDPYKDEVRGASGGWVWGGWGLGSTHPGVWGATHPSEGPLPRRVAGLESIPDCVAAGGPGIKGRRAADGGGSQR